MFDQDIIFRRHAEEKLDPKDQIKITETKKTNQDHPGFIHHPSGLVIKKKHPGKFKLDYRPGHLWSAGPYWRVIHFHFRW